MGQTRIPSSQVRDGDGVRRPDLNTTTVGEAVIAKALEGTFIDITETGADEGTGDVTINVLPHSHLSQDRLTGRFEIDTDADWACWSDPNFGPSLQDWDLDLADNGVGGIPAIDWDGLGWPFSAGTILKRMLIKLRANNDDVDSIQTYVRMHDVDLTASDPIDSNGEVGAVEIDGIRTFDLDAGAKQANDLQLIEIPLGDYVVQNDGADLHLMMKAPAGTLTAGRQIRCSVIIEYILPNDLEDNP